MHRRPEWHSYFLTGPEDQDCNRLRRARSQVGRKQLRVAFDLHGAEVPAIARRNGRGPQPLGRRDDDGIDQADRERTVKPAETPRK